MPSTKTEALQRAIDYLGAQEVRAAGEYCQHGGDEYGPCPSGSYCEGTNPKPARYAFKPKGEAVWYVTDDPELESERARVFRESGDDLIAEGEAVAMKPWWSPDRQTAWRDKDRLITEEQMRSEPAIVRAYSKRITCDLATGAEVPA